MTHENVAIVKSLYEQWSRGDYDDRQPFAEDLDFQMSGSVWLQQEPVRARGIDGMSSVWKEVLRDWDDFHAGPIEELIEVGDQIVVLNRLVARGKQTGIKVDSARGAVFTFERGKITRLFLADRDEFLEAVGLSE